MKIIWGDDPYFFGPRDYFRNYLIAREIRKFKNRNINILDFGCGCGNLAIKLAQWGFHITGFDVSQLSLEVLKSKVEQFSLKNFITVENDIEKIQNTNIKFEIICAGEVLEHIKDDKKVVKFFKTLLKEGGFCVLTVPARMKYWDRNDEIAGHFRRYEKEELIDLFAFEGFKIKKIYCFGPITFLWHKLIFLPIFIRRQFSFDTIQRRKNSSLLAHLLYINKILVYFFYIDFLFLKLNCWNHYLMVAYKKHEENVV